MENFDVVIPTGKNIKQSDFSICYTIRSILAQDIQPRKIIIVINALNTGVEEVVNQQFGQLVTLVSGTECIHNISYARNLGAKNCNSETIIFMDDDVVLGYHDHFSRIQYIMEYNDFCCGAKRYWTTVNWAHYLSMDYPMNHNLLLLKSKSYLPLSAMAGVFT